MMNRYRESLVDRMITLYGFESPVVIQFARLAEYWRGDEQVLRIIVEAHEAHPWVED